MLEKIRHQLLWIQSSYALRCALPEPGADTLSLVAGGFFTGRYTNPNAEAQAGGRFDPETLQGKVSAITNSSKIFIETSIFRATDANTGMSRISRH